MVRKKNSQGSLGLGRVVPFPEESPSDIGYFVYEMILNLSIVIGGETEFELPLDN